MAQGVPTELTPKLFKAIVDTIAAGNFRYHAADAVGIAPRTLRLWMTKAKRQGEASEYFSLYTAIKRAEAQAIITSLKYIHNAAKDGQWTAAAWYLERKATRFYGKDRGELKKALEELKELKALVADLVQSAGRNGTTAAAGRRVNGHSH